jgi:hypothetical protein
VTSASRSKRVPSQGGADKKRRKRAKSVVNWLGFIRPLLQDYAALPAGAQVKLLQKLSRQRGTSVNTLRRYVGAARFLERVFAITEFPPGRPRLPVASVEAIARIYRKDAGVGHALMDELVAGHLTIVALKKKLKTMGRGARVKPGAAAISERDIVEDVAELHKDLAALVARGQLHTAPFSAWSGPSRLFGGRALPACVVATPERRWIAVFDEAALAWAVSPATVAGEFLANIAIASATFDFVLVYCTSLQRQAHSVVASLVEDCRRRVRVRPPAAA